MAALLVMVPQASFTNDGTINLTSSGNFGADLNLTSGTITNNGELNFQAGLPGSSSIRNLTSDLDNRGTLTVDNGVTANFDKTSGVYDNNGRIVLDGPASRLDIVRGTLTNLRDGTIAGTGFVDLLNGTGSLQNSGTLMPGLSPGELTINGDVINDSLATLSFEIGGTVAGLSHDLLTITNGDLTLGGAALELFIIDSFVPDAADFFDIATAVNVLGTFGNLDLNNRVQTADNLGTFLVSFVDGDTVRLSDLQALNVGNNNDVPETPTLILMLLGLAVVMRAARRRATA